MLYTEKHNAHVTVLFLFLTSNDLEVKVFMNFVVDQRVAEEFK